MPFGNTRQNDKILMAIIIREPISRAILSSNLQVILIFGTSTREKCNATASCKLQLALLQKRIESATS